MAPMVLCALLLIVPVSVSALEGLHPGDAAPAFSLPDIASGRVALGDLAGSPALVVFWSTWSPRSAEMLADVAARHGAWSAAGLRVVAVNADAERLDDSGRGAVRDCARRLGLPFPVVVDEGLATYAAYGVMALPTAVVVDAGGRIAYALGGYPFTLRDELAGQVALALGGGAPSGAAVAAAEAVPAEAGPPALPGERPGIEPGPGAACAVPRIRLCDVSGEPGAARAEPAVLAVRYTVCRGDADGAERMLLGVGSEALARPDLRFALANLMLLRSRTEEARAVFAALGRLHPGEPWGEWGLGIAALAAGDVEGALGHLRAARSAGVTVLEAPAAALAYLERHWRAGRAAPGEDQLLALFAEFASVRDCYRRRAAKG